MAGALMVTEVIAGMPKYTTDLFTAGISRYPTTPGQHIIVLHQPYLFALNVDDTVKVAIFAQEFAAEVKSVTQVKRCGLAYDGHQCLHIIPMHGLNEDWKPVMAPDTDLEDEFPGYLWTKNSAPMDEEKLQKIQKTLTNISGWHAPNLTFLGDTSDDNLFARLVRGQIPQWRIWEDELHVAFLTPFPNTPGFTVIIPRQHLSSDIFGLQAEDFERLVVAANEVSHILQKAFETERVGMFFEGFEIDYAHVKLIPILGSRELEGPSDEYHRTYPGYLTTRLGPEERDSSILERYR